MSGRMPDRSAAQQMRLRRKQITYKWAESKEQQGKQRNERVSTKGHETARESKEARGTARKGAEQQGVDGHTNWKVAMMELQIKTSPGRAKRTGYADEKTTGNGIKQ